MNGVCIIAYGDKARSEAGMAVRALHNNGHKNVTIVSDKPLGDNTHFVQFPDQDVGARFAKLSLDLISPYDHTLYMDADTRTRSDISVIFDILADGFDLVIAPSSQQDSQCLHHIDDEERQSTFTELLNWNPLQLQGGVMGFRKSHAVYKLFSHWRDEWLRWRDQDQGALLRALDKMNGKPRIWLLSNEFNGGALVDHYFGRARRR